MKFTVNTRQFAKLLRVLVSNGGRENLRRNALLRLAAQHNKVSMRIDEVEGGCGAEIAEEGTCFFNYRKFLRLVRGYAKERNLTITVTAESIQIAHTR